MTSNYGSGEGKAKNFANDEERIIGLLMSSTEFAEKIIKLLDKKDISNLARAVVEEARIYSSKIQSDNLLALDGKLQSLRGLYESMYKAICFREHRGNVLSEVEFKGICNELEVGCVKSFLNQVLSSVENYVKNTNFLNNKFDIKDFKSNLEKHHSKFTESIAELTK